MQYKIGLILSTVFIVMFFMLGVDMLSIQFAFSDLDAKSTSIAYQIAQHGQIDNDFKSYLEQMYNLTISDISNQYPLFGEEVDYKLSKEITTILVSSGGMDISIRRSAVIGFFGWKEAIRMSELKGTLLGIILTLVLFGIISTTMTTAFNSMSSKIESEVTELVKQ